MATVIGEAGELGIAPERVGAFYDQHWPRKIALAVPSFYRWQFMSSPADGGADHCMVAVDTTADRILGVMGLNRRRMHAAGEVLNAAELTTWIVEPEYLGKGVGAKLLIEIQARYDALIGMGISAMALPIYLRSGFRYIRTIPRFVRVFDWDAVEPHARFDALGKKLARQWLPLGSTAFDAQPVSADAMAGLQALLPTLFNHYHRGADDLAWRYQQHPVFQYDCFVVRATGADAGAGVLVALRQELSVAGLRLVHVLDCVGDERDMPAAIGFIHDHCRQHGIHLADFYCTATRVSKHFVTSGWFSINDDLCFQFPHLFHPLELRDPPTTSLVYWSRQHMTALADTANLYITKQDADLDRPTMATYEALQAQRARP